MTPKTRAPYGSWPSPVKPSNVSTAGISYSELQVVGDTLYWLENRPNEEGRACIVERQSDGSIRDLTPAPFNVRTAVHEYGGGSWLKTGSALFFCNYSDQQIYRVSDNEPPSSLTPGDNGFRYADFAMDEDRGNLYCIREDHSGNAEAVNTLVMLDAREGGKGEIIFEGTDFVAAPRLSPDGSELAWISWNHPKMPWDETTLHLAKLDKEGRAKSVETLKSPEPASILQPTWSPDSKLHFVADWENWWNLYCWEDGESKRLHAHEAEFGWPAWIFSLQNYTLLSENLAFVSYGKMGEWFTGELDLKTGALTTIGEAWSSVRSVTRTNKGAAFFAERPNAATGLYEIVQGKIHTIFEPNEIGLDQRDISVPEAIAFPTSDGETAYGFYYPPANKSFEGPQGKAPPLFVKVHGGPTTATTSAYSSRTQYWTNRGFAVLDLNYRGSTGFGRTYRHKLQGTWGIADVEDAIHGAQYLVSEGSADKDKLAISGGSAGGYTVLSALTFHDTFTAGASYFGVSDVEALAADTHKFESRYVDGLIGPYPEAIDIYRERSPIHATEKLNVPLLLLQGLEDKVVPPSQSEDIYKALKSKGVPVAYIAFEKEGHGFRIAANIEKSLEAELHFYGRAFDFTPADAAEPFVIDNEEAFS